MKNRILALLVALALASTAWAMTSHYSSGASGLAITTANRNTPFTDNHSGGGATTFQAKHVLIRSRAASVSSCHFDLGDGVATTADTRVEPGASVVIEWDERSGGAGGGWNRIGAICGSGTATWDVDAWR